MKVNEGSVTWTSYRYIAPAHALARRSPLAFNYNSHTHSACGSNIFATILMLLGPDVRDASA
jgi:hypothetical protein